MAEVPSQTTQRGGARRALSRWISDQIVDNPIFLREMRRRMRGKALFAVMMLYIGVISVVAWIVILSGVSRIHSSGTLNVTAHMGSMSDTLFRSIALIQALLVLIIGPVITADIPTSEREKKTMDFLQVTTLSPAALVFGTLASTMLYILLVLLCALPVLCVTFLFGGVAPSDIISSFGSLLLLSTIFSAMALWLSSLRTKGRTPQMALLFVAGIFVVGILAVRVLSSFLFMGGGGVAFLPFARMLGGGVIIFGVSVAPWVIDVVGALLLIAFLFLLASRRMFNPENRALTYWQGALLFLAAISVPVWRAWGPGLTDPQLIALFSIPVWGLLTVYSLIYQTPRLEMGNEIWRMKRRFKFLRRVDESFLFMGLLLTMWWALWSWWIHGTLAMFNDTGWTQTVWNKSFITVTCVVIAQGMLCRQVSLMAKSRDTAFKITCVILVVIYGALPLLAIAMESWTAGSGHPFRLWTINLAPWAQLMMLGGEANMGSAAASLFATQSSNAMPVIYLGIALVLGLTALAKHRKYHSRWPITYEVQPGQERNISKESYVNERVIAELQAAAAAKAQAE